MVSRTIPLTMKSLRIILVCAALSLLSICAKAQGIIIGGHWIPILANAVSNPGFENGFSNWDNSQSYYEDSEGDFNYIDLGYVTSDAHTGKHGFDMDLGNPGGGLLDCVLHQDLTNPIAVNTLTDAYAWIQASSGWVYIP